VSHAPLSPSAMQRSLACPYSLVLGEGRSSPSSPASRRGDYLHSIAASAATSGGLDAALKNPAVLAAAAKAAGETFIVGPAEHAMLRAYLDVLAELDMLASPTAKRFVEHKSVLNLVCYGTADFVLLDVASRRLDIVDLKTGSQFVEVEENAQLGTYALSELRNAGFDTKGGPWTVVLHIVQGTEHREWQAPMEWLTKLDHDIAVLSVNYAGRKIDTSSLNPGDHCRYCPGSDRCPARSGAALTAAQAVFGDLDAPPKTPPVVATMTTAQLQTVVAAEDIITDWIKSARKELTNRLIAGEAVPGFKLVKALGNRVWTDPAAAARVLRRHGVNPYDEPELKSPATIEKMSKALKPVVDELTTRPDRGVVMAPERDKRPAVTGAAAIPFEALED